MGGQDIYTYMRQLQSCSIYRFLILHNFTWLDHIFSFGFIIQNIIKIFRYDGEWVEQTRTSTLWRKQKKKDNRPCYRYPTSLQELKDRWDQICVTWFLGGGGGGGAASNKICQFKKWRSTLFSNNRKWRTFILKLRIAKYGCKWSLLLFDRRCLHGKQKRSKTQTVHFV